ncbi:hypothetical protein BO94DRAFT_178242 [Aspergillus sclerotioniger CBS 115572]|uniref:Uncharacterized protein n=1 Tax=Aspergillus sclerotioniger CBS 115572 TaxID=1450535 RepID=A0A317W2R0_9EURO|nr:hypothetical protein BO94DRAFT_178242 [Aspergillus sclerotioniger CBS 115572]PWY78470.1 hypothetical protein BO94DRAFT_178242 [Aspergillus sclerotioniger CBS 115572]
MNYARPGVFPAMRLLILDHTVISALASLSCSPLPPTHPAFKIHIFAQPVSPSIGCMIRYRTSPLPLPSQVHTPPQLSTSSRLVPSITHISKIGSHSLWSVSLDLCFLLLSALLSRMSSIGRSSDHPL